MIKAKVAPFYFGCIYDVAKQGGAVGSVATGLILPPGAMIIEFGVQVITQCVSAGNGDFQFGYAGALAAYGAYPHLVYAADGLTSLAHATTVEKEVLISIAGAPIQSGKIKIHWTLVVVNGK